MFGRFAMVLTIVAMMSPPVYAQEGGVHEGMETLPIEECTGCHEDTTTSAGHGPVWVNEHRLFAENRESSCSECHTQSYCLDCHYGGGIDRDLHSSRSGADYMPKSHRSDFREIHPLKVFDDPASCYRCHDTQRFCNDCHEKFNDTDLKILSHRKGFSNLTTGAGGIKHSTFTVAQCQTCHPNSVLPKHEWSASHAREARKNLAACQSCHLEGEVCLSCHSAKTGLKRNPHPKNWDAISDRLQSASDRRSCVKCH
jgi:hypothetical protein